jgi:hypothetical protein
MNLFKQLRREGSGLSKASTREVRLRRSLWVGGRAEEL